MEVAEQMEVKTSVSNKRKRLHSGDAAAVLLQSSPDDSHAAHCPVSVANLPENSVSSTKMCEDSDEVPGSSLGLMNQSMIKCPVSLDLKVRSRNSSTSKLVQSSVLVTDADEISLTSPGGFSNRETEELMESSETTTKKAKFSTSLAAVAKMPSTEEIEEFLAAAEKHEQRRFAEKYNYDIVKDVPLEGRYQWVCLKP